MSNLLIRVFFNRNYLEFNWMDHNHSLLKALENNQVKTESQCRSGYCGTCRIFLISGKIKYYLEPIAFVGSKEILPCCCYPIENIELRL